MGRALDHPDPTAQSTVTPLGGSQTDPQGADSEGPRDVHDDTEIEGGDLIGSPEDSFGSQQKSVEDGGGHPAIVLTPDGGRTAYPTAWNPVMMRSFSERRGPP